VQCITDPGGGPPSRHTHPATLDVVTDDALAAAGAAVHENTPEGWYGSQPLGLPERNGRSMDAFDPSE